MVALMVEAAELTRSRERHVAVFDEIAGGSVVSVPLTTGIGLRFRHCGGFLGATQPAEWTNLTWRLNALSSGLRRS